MKPITVLLRAAATAAVLALLAMPAAAQTTDDPAALNLAEPDFTLISLPTSLRRRSITTSLRSAIPSRCAEQSMRVAHVNASTSISSHSRITIQMR